MKYCGIMAKLGLSSQSRKGGRLQKLEFVMPEYRRKKGSDVWHWCRNCDNWPTSDYKSIKTSEFPADGKLDDECRVKELTGNCHT